MATVTTIPVNIAADAAEHVRQLGMQPQFETMLERLREIIPGIRAIDVSLEYPPDYVDDPVILLTTYQPRPPAAGDPTRSAWRSWMISTFSPDILKHFVRLPFYISAIQKAFP